MIYLLIYLYFCPKFRFTVDRSTPRVEGTTLLRKNMIACRVRIPEETGLRHTRNAAVPSVHGTKC